MLGVEAREHIIIGLGAYRSLVGQGWICARFGNLADISCRNLIELPTEKYGIVTMVVKKRGSCKILNTQKSTANSIWQSVREVICHDDKKYCGILRFKHGE